MERKELYKMINEEISDFDFLGMDNVNDEEVHDSVLTSKEFQTNLIKDIINKLDDKDIFNKLSATYVNKDTDRFNDIERIELEIELSYIYNEKNYELILFIAGEKDEEIKYDNFSIKLFSKAGDQINLSWIDKNPQLYKRFIESLVSPYID